MIRSPLLTHWIGKHIATKAEQLRANASKRQEFVECVIDVLANGMWMTVQREALRGWIDARSREADVLPGNMAYLAVNQENACTCFTETRLSKSKAHSSRYGLLGFVVTRRFVFDRYGGPVHYVRGHEDDVITGRLGTVLDALYKWKTDDVEALRSDLTRHMAYVKTMSTPGTDDFAFLDENEWRVAYSERALAEGNIAETGQPTPPFRLTFDPSELEMLILPDTGTRSLLAKDDRFARLSRNRILPLLTVEEASHL